jgi:beta-lactamase superfamily II metal-dependent hydrolase
MHIFSVGAANFILFRTYDENGQHNLIVDAGYDVSAHEFETLSSELNQKYFDKHRIIQTARNLIGNAPTVIIISHLDKDHHCLLANILKTPIDVRKIIVGAKSSHIKRPLPLYLRSRHIALVENKISKHVENNCMANSVSVQQSLGSNCKVKILLPRYHRRVKNRSDNNDDSLVVFIKAFGRTILICGDASINLLSDIQNTYPSQLQKVDVLVLPHHASITNGQKPVISLFKPALCICSTRPHPFKYRFPKCHLVSYPFIWAIPAFVATHSLTCCFEDQEEIGDITTAEIFGNICKFRDISLPLFSTFDSNSKFYLLNISKEGIIHMFSSNQLLFQSFSIEEEKFLYSILFRDGRHNLASSNQQLEFLRHLLLKDHKIPSFVSLLILANILDNACNEEHCWKVINTKVVSDMLKIILSTNPLQHIPNQFCRTIAIELARFICSVENCTELFSGVLTIISKITPKLNLRSAAGANTKMFKSNCAYLR